MFGIMDTGSEGVSKGSVLAKTSSRGAVSVRAGNMVVFRGQQAVWNLFSSQASSVEAIHGQTSSKYSGFDDSEQVEYGTFLVRRIDR